MASSLSDEIDVLVKARREIGGSYVPSEDEDYMNEAQPGGSWDVLIAIGWGAVIAAMLFSGIWL